MADTIPEFISSLRKVRDQTVPAIEAERILSQTAATTATEQAVVATTQATDATTENTNAQLAKTAAELAQSEAEDAETITLAAKDQVVGMESNVTSLEASVTQKHNQIIGLTAVALTLTAGTNATASYNSTTGIMTIGVPTGLTGDKGDPFLVNAQGLIANRSTYDNEDTGFSFLATDEGLLYFKQSATSADWSTGTPFGKGETGDNGESINMQVTAENVIQWQYPSQGVAWNDLINLDTVYDGTYLGVLDSAVNSLRLGGVLASEFYHTGNKPTAAEVGAVDDTTVHFKANSIGISSDGTAIKNDDGTTNNNIGIGHNASSEVTTGNHNIGIGHDALLGIITGSKNIGLGDQAGVGFTGEASYNTAIGYATTGISPRCSGQSNIIMGKDAAMYDADSDSSYSVIIGDGAGKRLKTDADNNVIIGRKAAGDGLLYRTHHHSNVFIGAYAGYKINTGARNVCIGYEAGYNSVGSDKLHIANNSAESLIEGNFAAKTVKINGDLEVTGRINGVERITTESHDTYLTRANAEVYITHTSAGDYVVHAKNNPSAGDTILIAERDSDGWSELQELRDSDGNLIKSITETTKFLYTGYRWIAHTMYIS